MSLAESQQQHANDVARQHAEAINLMVSNDSLYVPFSE